MPLFRPAEIHLLITYTMGQFSLGHRWVFPYCLSAFARGQMIELTHITFFGADPAPAASAPAPRSVGPRAPRGVCAEPTDPDVAWLLSQAGLDPSAYRSDVLKRRVPAYLRRLRVPSLPAARQLLERKKEFLPDALSSMLLGVTGFFRDPAVFHQLGAQVLPELLRDRSMLRCCSLGASEGHELYSVAMLLEDAGVLASCRLLGVDCRSDALAAARAGVFDEASVSTLPAYFRFKYFFHWRGRWLIRNDLRHQICWERRDVVSSPVQGEWDLILFRNVAIYLNAPRATAAWTQIFHQLAPGGVLVTGKAERPPAHLPLRRLGPCIYRRLDQPCR